MSISGKLFQFNIGSNISFQLRANFASIHNNRAQAEDHLNQRRGEELEKSNRQADKAKWSKQDRFYEVIGPYVNGPAALAQKPTSAMFELPERIVEESALLPTEASSSDRHIARAHQWRGRTQQNLSGRRTEYIHSYNRDGQTVFATSQTSAVNFFI